MIQRLTSILLVFLIACNNPTGKSRTIYWTEYVGHSTTIIDTTIDTAPFVQNFVDVGNLNGLLFKSSKNIALEKHGDSLQILMLDSGSGRIVFFDSKNHDTVININVICNSNPEFEVARLMVNEKQSNLYYDSLASFIYSMGLLNKPFPNVRVNTISGKILILPNETQGVISIINAWYYGCPPCMEEIPGLNRLREIYNSDEVSFIALFKDSAYIENGKMKFYQEYYSAKKGKVEGYIGFDKYKFTHAIGAKYLEDVLTIHGYPKTFLIDKDGMVRLIIEGGSDKVGPFLDQQIKLYQKSSGFLL